MRLPEHQVEGALLLNVVIREGPKQHISWFLFPRISASRAQTCRPRAACQQRSASAGPGGCLPYPGSSPSHSQWCQKARPRNENHSLFVNQSAVKAQFVLSGHHEHVDMLYLKGDGLARQGLHKDLHDDQPAASENQAKK